MASVFTKIINGELPGRFVWRDDQVVAFLTTAPMNPGHTLVVPRQEIDYWIDLPPELSARVMQVAQTVSRAIQNVYNPKKVGLTIVGLEVPHVHLHLVPINAITDMNFDRQDKNASPDSLDAAAEKIRAELRNMGHGQNCEQTAP
jgi:diadenosine tetraphosphate (Ap4A) HIT family hydrolase